jgi:hypothetical protein
MIGDNKLDPRAAVALKELPIPLITATTQTDVLALNYKPGYSFELAALRGSCSAEAGAVTANVVIAPPTAILLAGAISVHSTPEQLASAIARYIIGGKVISVAAGTALAFSAAHVVTASKFGAILLQRSNAGAWSTKVPAATATTAMAYDTATAAELAVLALSPDADKIAVGHIIIAADSGGWTAITDDLTNGSDLTTATITTYAAQARACSSALAFVAGEEARGTLSTDRTRVRGSKTDHLIVLYTTDGTGALTNGVVTPVIKIRPAAGQSSYE